MLAMLLSATLSCQDATKIANNALDHPNLPRDVITEIIKELDNDTGGQCNLPGLEPNESV